MPKQFTQQQRLDKCRTIHFHKRALRALAVLVNRRCNQLFARSRLTLNQHRGIRLANSVHHTENLSQARVLAHNTRIARAPPQVLRRKQVLVGFCHQNRGLEPRSAARFQRFNTPKNLSAGTLGKECLAQRVGYVLRHMVQQRRGALQQRVRVVVVALGCRSQTQIKPSLPGALMQRVLFKHEQRLPQRLHCTR